MTRSIVSFIIFLFISLVGLRAQDAIKEIQLLIQAKNFQAADQHLTLLEEDTTFHQDARWWQYRIYVSGALGDYEKARKSFKNAINQYSDSWALWYTGGKLELANGEANKAIHNFGRAFDYGTEKEKDSVSIDLAELYLSTGRNNSAVKYLKRLEKNDPHNYRVFYLKGLYMALNRDAKEAEIALTKSIELNKDFGPAYTERGLARINLLLAQGIKPKSKNSGEACQDFENAMELGHEQAREMFNKFCD